MKKTHMFVAMVILLHIFGITSPLLANTDNAVASVQKAPKVTFKKEFITIKTQNNNLKYHTEIAQTKEQMELGLMHRKFLPQNAAMLFLFKKEQKIYMWMKNTLIPLDMLFIDNSGKIIHIAHNTKPNSLSIISAGERKSRAVLEIKGGSVRKHNIKVGDQIIYRAFKQ